jgi:DNA-binding response OmpR family regulator
MRNDDMPQVLTVGCENVPTDEASGFFNAESGKRAIELLRMLRFDLVLTNVQLEDGPAWSLIRKMKAAWPWQKWAMVGHRISPQDEITARTLGVIRIFDEQVDWDEVSQLADGIRRRAAANAVAALKKVPVPSVPMNEPAAARAI